MGYRNVKKFKNILENIRHRHDDLKYRGYDYHGKVFRRTLSSIYFSDEKRSKFLDKLDEIFCFVIDYVKMIKKSYFYVFDKDYIKFN